MPYEATLPDVIATEYEAHETDVTPAEFCQAFQDISNLQRHTTASVLHLRPGLLTAGNVPSLVGKEHTGMFLQKVDAVVNSEQMRSHIELCIENGNYSNILQDEHIRSYIMGLARTGFMGGLIDGLLNAGNIPPYEKRVYRQSLIEMNHGFKELVDSPFGREVGFSRQNLKHVIGEACGSNYDITSARITNKIEMGVAAEVATKRYIEKKMPGTGVGVRDATAEEDSKKIDLVCRYGNLLLGIDVKSGDKHSGGPKDARAWYSPIEEFGIGEYRVRELYPALETCIGNNFEIKAKAYEKKIDELLEEFRTLA